VQGPFVRRLPGVLTFFSRILVNEKSCPISRGQATRPDSVCWQPLRSMATQCLPTCCCKSLGTLELYTGSAHSRYTNQESSHSPMPPKLCHRQRTRMPFHRNPLSLSGFLRKTRPHLRFTGLKLHGVRGKRATPAFVAQQSAESIACRSAWQRSASRFSTSALPVSQASW